MSLNLLDEPWLPVVRTDGTPGEVGIRDALVDGQHIRSLVGETPLQTAALHRLLLAVLHRALMGPRDAAAWRELFSGDVIPVTSLLTYLERWDERFDLLDGAHPFYQVAELDPDRAKSIARLTFFDDNNPTLFEHQTIDDPKPLSAAQTARALVTAQAFHPGGLMTGPSGNASAKHAPLVNAAVFLVPGGSLWETLTLNLHGYNGRDQRPFEFDDEADSAPWERDAATGVGERHPRGYVDLLTWQSRRIRLLQDDTGMSFRKAVFMPGEALPPDMLQDLDPMLGFRKLKTGWLPLGFREGRALWRDSMAVLGALEGHVRPRMLSWLAEAGSGRDVLLDDLMALGGRSKQSKFLFWRSEFLPVTSDYLRDEEGYLVEELGRAVELAEDVGLILTDRRVRGPLGSLGGDLGLSRSQVGQFIQSSRVADTYWEALDAPFRDFVYALPVGIVPESPTRSGAAPGKRWAGVVRAAARDAFEQLERSLSRSGRSLRAIARARGRLERSVGAAVNTYTERWEDAA